MKADNGPVRNEHFQKSASELHLAGVLHLTRLNCVNENKSLALSEQTKSTRGQEVSQRIFSLSLLLRHRFPSCVIFNICNAYEPLGFIHVVFGFSREELKLAAFNKALYLLC